MEGVDGVFMQINLPPELEEQVSFWATKSHETPSELALRLIEEYVEDCRDTEDFFAKEGMDTSCLYSSPEVKQYLGLEG